MKNKCVVSTIFHKNCKDNQACLADPAGIMHGPVEVVPCGNDAFDETRFCVDHIERYGTVSDKLKLAIWVANHTPGSIERLRKSS